MSKTISGGMPQQYQDTTAEVYKNSPLGLLVPKWHQLIALARTLSSQQQQHALAIVLAAAAGEWVLTFTLNTLLNISPPKSRGPVKKLKERIVGGKPITWSLENRDIRKAYFELTNEDPETQSWWTDWTTSRNERHEIVHQGKLTADAAVAKLCIDAAETCIAHLIDVVQSFAVPTP
jgi:hypothetical protein